MALILNKSKRLSLNLAPVLWFDRRKNFIFYLQLFSSSTASQNPEPKSKSIENYFITSCGFSPQKAATASKYFAKLNPPSNPDSVRHFFKHHGFTDKETQNIILRDPRILCADVRKTLEPSLQSLIKTLNLPDPDLKRLLISDSRLLVNPRAISRLEFWKAFTNNDMKNLLAIFTRNLGLASSNIDTCVAPKISLLKDYGLSQANISMLLRISGFIRRPRATIESSLKKVEEMGIQCGSSTFVIALACLGDAGPEVFKGKMEVFKRLGWTESMFLSAFKKFPIILRLSEQGIQEKMEFLVSIAGCTPDYVALCPMLLGYSLEKRMRPRHQVLGILKANEVLDSTMGIYGVMCLGEGKFFDKFVLPYKETVLKLHEAYITASGNQPSLWKKGCF